MFVYIHVCTHEHTLMHMQIHKVVNMFNGAWGMSTYIFQNSFPTDAARLPQLAQQMPSR